MYSNSCICHRIPSFRPRHRQNPRQHGAVAAVLSHRHHLIIRLGAAPIKFVYGLRSKLGHGAHISQIFAIFFGAFSLRLVSELRYRCISFWIFLDPLDEVNIYSTRSHIYCTLQYQIASLSLCLTIMTHVAAMIRFNTICI